jgi:hypothetical protein
MGCVSVHAFVDESFRDGWYLLTAALVQPGDLRRLRTVLRGLLLPGQREMHLKAEKAPRRRALLDQLVASGAVGTVYVASATRATQEAARALCLHQLTVDLLKAEAHRLVLDSRGDRDRFDVRTLQAALGAHPAATRLTYEHLDSAHELLIGVADMIGWAYGAGGDWRRRVAPAVTSVIECR